MSSALAIASVTHILKDILNDGLVNRNVSDAVNGTIKVSSLPPDRISTENEESQLNLFMYMASQNAAWRNHDLPARSSRGGRITNPPLALDLHYLLTAYGAEELHHEILLGYGMQFLHETPFLARDAIRESLKPPAGIVSGVLSNEVVALSGSKLAEQIELIKITPETLNTEEISRLWTAFGAKYRPHAAYKATVVLIESEFPTQSNLPVRERKIFVEPFRRPVIEKISSQAGDGLAIIDNQKILPGYNLVINGRQLTGKITTVNVGGELVENIPILGDKQLVFALPANLSAGVHGLQIDHKIPKDPTQDPPVDTLAGASSNVEAFVLSPNLTAAITVNPISGPDIPVGTMELGFSVEPAIGENQRFVLLLNQISATPPDLPAAYSFEISARTFADPPAPVNNFSLRLSELRAGTYIVRIQVDGAESPLVYTQDVGYTAPSIVIPSS